MTDRLDFEGRLEARLLGHTADVVRPFDAAAIAAMAAGRPRRRALVVRRWSLARLFALGVVALLALALGVALLSGSRPPTPIPAVVSATPRASHPTSTSVPEPTRLPVLAGSGRLAFIDTGESHCMSINEVDAATGSTVRTIDCAQWVSLSPDGTHAASARLDATGAVAILDVVDLRTGERREITRSSDRGMVTGAFSPDGRFLTWAWCDGVTSCDIVGAAVADMSTAIPTIVELPRDTRWSDLQWSPDSAWLAIETNDGLSIAHGDGSDPQRIASGAVLAWSPDSTELALKADAGLEVVQRDGSGSRWVSDVSTYFGSGSWSPDGRSIAFATDGPLAASFADTNPAQLWIVGADGAGRLRVDVGPGCAPMVETPAPQQTPRLDCHDSLEPMAGSPLSWSPDGRRFTVPLKRVGDSGSGPVAVGIVEAATGHVTRIDRAQASAWSPDGTQLMVVNGAGIDVLSADGSDRRQVLVATGTSINPEAGAWVPD